MNELHLNFNNISSLPEYVFKDLTSLQKLHLDHNLLKIIHGQTFVTNLNLEVIGLSRNYITAIENSTFDKLSLNTLYLQQNPCFQETIVVTKFFRDAIKECIQGYENLTQKKISEVNENYEHNIDYDYGEEDNADNETQEIGERSSFKKKIFYATIGMSSILLIAVSIVVSIKIVKIRYTSNDKIYCDLDYNNQPQEIYANAENQSTHISNPPGQPTGHLIYADLKFDNNVRTSTASPKKEVGTVYATIKSRK